jgi:hypothetical protein
MGQPVEVRVLSRAKSLVSRWRLINQLLLQQKAKPTGTAKQQFESTELTYPYLFFLPPIELSSTGKAAFAQQE